MHHIEELLSGGDLRSIGKSNSVALKVHNQKDFDELFAFLFHTDRIVVMRAADGIEKITIKNPSFLAVHKKEILELSKSADDKELQWHLALLLPRLQLTQKELGRAWSLLRSWAADYKKSRIVRVNSIQGLFELTQPHGELTNDFNLLISRLERENIPSITARINKLKKGGLPKRPA